MKIKQTNPFFVVISLVASLSVIAAFFLQGSPVRAACEENAGQNDQCYYDNYNAIQDKRGITKEKYNELVQNCHGKGGGLFGLGGADEGSCSNAVSGCIKDGINLDNCSNGDKMAEVADCQTGNVSQQNCLMTLNIDDFIKANDDTKKQIMDTCTQRVGNEAQDTQNCEKAYTDAQAKCDSERQKLGSSANTYDRYTRTTYDKYSSCLNDEMLKSSKDPAECKARGGEMQATSGQTGNDTGVCVPLSPPVACLNGLGPLSSGQKRCVCDDGSIPNQSGTCKDGSSSHEPDATGTGRGTHEEFGKCGEAQTVLIKCTGTGVGAINDVLKIIINVLTVIVGIAAVGGLAWASIQYAKAEDDSGKVKESRTLIRNIVIGLILYGFLVGLMNWLVPGGVIGS